MTRSIRELLSATAIFAAVLAATSLPAQAQDYFNPYIGADYQLTHVDYDGGGDDNFNGININVGNRFTDHVGVELGYFRTGTEKESGIELGIPYALKARLTGATLDAIGYLPVTQDKSLELLGTVGLSYIRADLTLDMLGVTVKDDESEWGLRAGAGVQYNLTEQVSFRGLARYQTADFEDSADHALVLTLGAQYRF